MFARFISKSNMKEIIIQYHFSIKCLRFEAVDSSVSRIPQEKKLGRYRRPKLEQRFLLLNDFFPSYKVL